MTLRISIREEGDAREKKNLYQEKIQQGAARC
jgi:hypothetical protein